MYRFLLFAFCLIFSANTEEQIVSIENMSGYFISVSFNVLNYDLSYRYDFPNSQFSSINIDQSLEIPHEVKCYIKAKCNTRYFWNRKCTFTIDEFQETQIKLIPNRFNIRNAFYTDKHCITRYHETDQECEEEFKFLVIRYTKNMFEDTRLYFNGGCAVLNIHEPENTCSIQ